MRHYEYQWGMTSWKSTSVWNLFFNDQREKGRPRQNQFSNNRLLIDLLIDLSWYTSYFQSFQMLCNNKPSYLFYRFYWFFNDFIHFVGFLTSFQQVFTHRACLFEAPRDVQYRPSPIVGGSHDRCIQPRGCFILETLKILKIGKNLPKSMRPYLLFQRWYWDQTPHDWSLIPGVKRSKGHRTLNIILSRETLFFS